MITLISSFKHQGETEHYVRIDIDGTRYEYCTSSYIAERFAMMLRKGGGYKALNYLKRNSTTYSTSGTQTPQ